MMEASEEEFIGDGEAQIMERLTSGRSMSPPRTRHPKKNTAYIFDGFGRYSEKEWDLAEGRNNEFCWYHVELPKDNRKIYQLAQIVTGALCPPLKLQDILSLASNGPFCGHIDGALVFRVNSPGPPASKYTFRIAARVTQNSVISVILGHVPRLGFSRTNTILSDVPVVETPTMSNTGKQKDLRSVVIKEHELEFYLTWNHSEEADNPVPKSVSNLVVHLIDTHVDHIQDVVTKEEMELDAMELKLDKGKSYHHNKTRGFRCFLLRLWLLQF